MEMDRKRIKSLHLPEETMEEILSRLPVKSLLRFRCVSKPWLSLISSERFIEAHRQNSTKNRAFSHHRVIFRKCGGAFKQFCVQQLLKEASSIKACRIHDPTNNQLLGGAHVVGSCNGLLCLINYQRVLFLWNPATMIFMELPRLNGLRFTKGAFGWDGRSGAYKVFALSTHRGITKGNVYSSNTNSWKTVDHGCLPLYDLNGVLSCGKIHWLASSAEYIESFDLGSEEFGRIELPFPFTCNPKERFHYTLAENGGCLHLVRVHVDHHRHSYEVVVLVMKESGWSKLFAFPPIFFNYRYVPICPLLEGGPNGGILLMNHDDFLVYCPKDDVLVVLPVKNRFSFYEGCVCVETLVSPNFTTAS